MRRIHGLIAGWTACIVCLAVSTAQAEPADLSEAVPGQQAYRVQTTVKVDGQVQTTKSDGQVVPLKLDVDSQYTYRERRLSGIGRDAQTLRSVRKYEVAKARIQVAEQVSTPRARETVSLLVAEGEREGVRLFSPAGPLTYHELELLRIPGDSLAVLALLPEKPISTGDTWTPPEWSLQFLTAVEAVESSKLDCVCETLTAQQARVKFEGKIVGGILGAAVEITVSGHYLFDVQARYLTRLEMTQHEKRSVSPVSPGLDLTAKVVMDRSRAAATGLAATDLEGIPLESNPATSLVVLDAPAWGVRCYHDRRWHLFHQNPQVAVLRMIDRGSLVAQCNVSPIAPAAPGQHVNEKQFQADVQKALGDDFRQFLQSDEIPTKDGRFIYRVAAVGETQQPVPAAAKSPKPDSQPGSAPDKKPEPPEQKVAILPVMWIYYLIASPAGKQTVLVFTLDPGLMERLDGQDFVIASGLEFPVPVAAPTPLSGNP